MKRPSSCFARQHFYRCRQSYRCHFEIKRTVDHLHHQYTPCRHRQRSFSISNWRCGHVSCSEKSAWHRWQFQCARTQSWNGQRHGGCDNSALWHDESTCWQPRNELSNSTSRILCQRFTSCHDCRCCARYPRSHRHRPDNQTVAGTRKKLVSVFMTVHPSEHLIFQ